MPQIDQEYPIWRNDLNGYRSEQRADVGIVVKRRIVQVSEIACQSTISMEHFKSVVSDWMETIERADDQVSAQACVATDLDVIIIYPVKATDPEREGSVGTLGVIATDIDLQRIQTRRPQGFLPSGKRFRYRVRWMLLD